MTLAISKKNPASSESAVRGERRNDFLAVVLSWPADAIQPRSLITHANAHTETHTHTVDVSTRTHTLCRCMLIQMEKMFSAGHIPKNVLWTNSVFEEGNGDINMYVRQIRSCICMRHTGWQYVNASGVCRAPKAFCGAHRWLRWAFANAHRVNETTRQSSADATQVRFRFWQK